MIFQDKTFACLTLVKRQSIILILSSKFYLRIRVTNKGYLNGQLLLAMPNITDPRFAKAVIYICTHTEDGAMGLIINKPCDNINFPNLLKQLSIQNIEKGISQKNLSQIPLHEGGPIESGRGFIIHSADYVQETTLIISETIALTATIDILTSIACEEGPRDYLITLGFSGWGKGQLEDEILRNSWLTIEADEELVFRTDLDLKFLRAMSKLGVDISMLSSNYGTA
jgi:putative transcriptional regulator